MHGNSRREFIHNVAPLAKPTSFPPFGAQKFAICDPIDQGRFGQLHVGGREGTGSSNVGSDGAAVRSGSRPIGVIWSTESGRSRAIRSSSSSRERPVWRES